MSKRNSAWTQGHISCAFTGHRPHKFPWKDNEADPRCSTGDSAGASAVFGQKFPIKIRDDIGRPKAGPIRYNRQDKIYCGGTSP